MAKVFSRYGKDIAVVIHTAAQPSHDWVASDPMTDFTVNASATLVLLELARAHCPEAPFLYLSTNKVYDDTPNRLPLMERETRWEVTESHSFAAHGIDETMSIDHTTHSLFGVSKAAADLMVQEFGEGPLLNMPSSGGKLGLSGRSSGGCWLRSLLTGKVDHPLKSSSTPTSAFDAVDGSPTGT
jgi:nucleoside-diphosphate-sugar epimerase